MYCKDEVLVLLLISLFSDASQFLGSRKLMKKHNTSVAKEILNQILLMLKIFRCMIPQDIDSDYEQSEVQKLLECHFMQNLLFEQAQHKIDKRPWISWLVYCQ